MNTNKGMSLIEVMVAVGIMSIMSFFIMDMVSNQNKAIKSTQHSLDVAEAVNQAQRYLVDSDICKNTLAGKNFLPNQNITITEIKRGPPLNTVLLTSANGHINKKIGGVEIENISVRRIDTTPDLILTMNLKKSAAGSSFGAQTFRKEFKLSARFKTIPANQVNQIETCYTEFDQGVTTAINQFKALMPQCVMLTGSSCSAGVYPNKAATYLLKEDYLETLRTCRTRYQPEICGMGGAFNRDCGCEGANCTCDNGRAGCFTRDPTSCWDSGTAIRQKNVPGVKCCQ